MSRSASARAVTFTHTSADVPAIVDFSFEFRPGTVTLLCGASGSGKSTVLRMLNGLVPHVDSGDLAGDVEVDGVRLADVPLWRAGGMSGTVFQNPRTQFFTSDVTSELAFGPENAGLAPGDIDRRISAAARLAGIEELLGRSLGKLSGGQQQRVACGAAVVGEAGFYLFDEPSSNLSPDAIADLRQIVTTLRAHGATIVVAEHRLYWLAGLVDDVLVLSSGQIERRLSGQQLFALTEHERLALGLRTLAPPVVELPAANDSAGPGVVLTDLRFGYGKHLVLDEPELHFPAGQVSVLTGPNGAGKTTLSRILCGLAEPWAGTSITLDGRKVDARARLAASSLVMQDVHRQLFGSSVAEEITLGLTEQQAQSVDVGGLLADMDLAGLAERHPLSLSGGQKQRLVIAAALARRCRIYLFDEPTSGVDYRHLQAITARIRSLAQAGNVVVVITHDIEFLAQVADRVVDLPLLTATDSSREETR